jgi:hypothetical protein
MINNSKKMNVFHDKPFTFFIIDNEYLIVYD